MERERSCCRRENVIKYPSSWADVPASAGLGNRLSRFFRRGAGTEFTDTAGRGHTPGWLLSAFVRFTFSPRPTGSPSSAPVCALGHLPLGRGKAGRAADSRPYGVYRSRPSFFVGAGHWPARRCTRRAESWFRPVSLALAGQFTFSRPTGCRDLHGRPHGAPTEGGRKFPKRAADSHPTKWVATCPLIRLAFARHLPPKGKVFGRPARVAPTAYPAPVPLVR